MSTDAYLFAVKPCRVTRRCDLGRDWPDILQALHANEPRKHIRYSKLYSAEETFDALISPTDWPDEGGWNKKSREEAIAFVRRMRRQLGEDTQFAIWDENSYLEAQGAESYWRARERLDRWKMAKRLREEREALAPYVKPPPFRGRITYGA